MENIHLSYYTIPVKLEDEENKYLLVHGYTGAIDIVDGSIWDGYSFEKTKRQQNVRLCCFVTCFKVYVLVLLLVMGVNLFLSDNLRGDFLAIFPDFPSVGRK